MTNLSELSNEINDLKRNANHSDYEKILDLFNSQIHGNYSIEEIINDRSIVSNIVFVLYKLKKYEKGINFIDNYLKLEIGKVNNEFTIGMYGWCVYQMLKSKIKEDGDWEDFEKDTDDIIDEEINQAIDSYYYKIEKIINALDFHNDKNYLVLKMLIFTFVKLVSQKAKNKWALGFDLLTSIDKETLKREVNTIKFKGKTKELASDYETWHAKMAKAYYELGRYEECKKFSEKTLNANILSHYDNDIWFKRRIALSDYHLGNLEAALSGMKEVIKIKKDWFVQKELAEIYYDLGNYEDALKYAIDSTINRGELKFKWELYYLIYQILMKLNDIPNALLYLKFSASIRLKEGWKLGEKLQNSLDKNNIPIDSIDFRSIQKNIVHFANSRLKIGKIRNINYQSKMGFISDSTGDTYFRFNVVKGRPDKLKQGDEVYFSSDVSYDKRKNRDSMAAVYVCFKNN